MNSSHTRENAFRWTDFKVFAKTLNMTPISQYTRESIPDTGRPMLLSVSYEMKPTDSPTYIRLTRSA